MLRGTNMLSAVSESAVCGGEVTPVKVDRWKSDIESMQRAIDALLGNNFVTAEQILRAGMDADPPTKQQAENEGQRDPRAQFALVLALVSMLRGVACFAKEQLAECEQRLKDAEKIAHDGPKWIGRAVTKGICGLSIGVLLLMQYNYVQGVYWVVKSWGCIKILNKQALNYDKKEKDVVRSAALFTVGAFYLLIDLLPEKAKKVASWVSGIKGSRKQGIDMIQSCWEEGQLLHAFAGLALIMYHVDTKTFLAEKLTEEELALTKKVVTWAQEKYPNSIFFSNLFADYIAVTERNTVLARATLEKTGSELEKLPALKWLLNYKRGIYEMCDCKWYEAGKHFQESMQVYVDGNRRSMVPFMASYAFLCFKQHELEHSNDTKDCATRVDHLVKLLRFYKNMDKSDWGRQDQYGFTILNYYYDEDDLLVEEKKDTKKKSKSKMKQNLFQWPLLHIAEIMVLYCRCTWWMSKQQLAQLLRKFDMEIARVGQSHTPDTLLRAFACKIDFQRQMGCLNEALKTYQHSLSTYGKSFTKAEKQFGAIPCSHFWVAKIYHELGDYGAAKLALDKVKKCGSKYGLNQLLVLKIVALDRLVSSEIDDKYEPLELGPGEKKTITLTLHAQQQEQPIQKPVYWFWVVKNNDISFKATFIPDMDPTNPVIIQKVGKHEAGENEEARFGVLTPEQPGKLELTWHNKHSLFMKTNLKYRVTK